jgi:hypothetical protein
MCTILCGKILWQTFQSQNCSNSQEIVNGPKYTLSQICDFKLLQLHKQKRKFNKNFFFNCTTSFPLWEWKHSGTEMAEAQCSATIQAMKWSCCDRWNSSVFELGFQQYLLAYMHVLDPVYTNFNLKKIWLLLDHLEHNCCVNWVESVTTLKKCCNTCDFVLVNVVQQQTLMWWLLHRSEYTDIKAK